MSDEEVKPWYDNFISINYTAWDETQANELGTFPTYDEAKQAVLDYAESIR